jgi:hypothetical protein
MGPPSMVSSELGIVVRVISAVAERAFAEFETLEDRSAPPTEAGVTPMPREISDECPRLQPV